MAAVVSTAFSRIFKITTEHYPVYYLTGTLLFSLMQFATTDSLMSIPNSSGLIKKVYIPKYLFPIEKCLFACVNALFSFAAVVIIMPLLGVTLQVTVLLFWIPIVEVVLFSVGLGLILSALNVFFRDIEHLYSVLTQAWLYLTPILYPAEALPESARWFLLVNPMYYYIDYFRKVVMYGMLPDVRLNIICLMYALGACIVGLVVFKQTQDKFILHI
jgi:ABC-2 type transport system permease protein